jgi:Cu/Ag efflux protein CusF
MNSKIMFAALLILAGAAGCSRQQEEMGPAQKAGKAVDDAGAKVAAKLHEPIDKANEAAQQARDQIKDAAEDARAGLGTATEKVGKKVEQAGEKIQGAAK